MKLTYIFHSGFVLETNNCILVFDYWHDPSDVMKNYVNRRNRQTLWGGCTDANPKLLLNDT